MKFWVFFLKCKRYELSHCSYSEGMGWQIADETLHFVNVELDILNGKTDTDNCLQETKVKKNVEEYVLLKREKCYTTQK